MITTEASKIRKGRDGIAVNFDRHGTLTANWDLAKTILRFAGFNTLSTDTPPLPFQVSRAGVLQQKLDEVGLRNVQVKPVIHKLFFHSGKEMWNWVTSSDPIAKEMISGLNDSQRNQVCHILEEILKARSGDNNTAVLNAAVHIGIGTK